MRDSLKNKILKYLEGWHKIAPSKFIHKSELEIKAKEKGYLSDNCTRILRKLCQEKLIEVRYAGRSQSAEYRFSPQILSTVTFWEGKEQFTLIDMGDRV